VPAAKSNRDKLTQQLLALLTRVCTGGRYADCVTEIWVFGSYARGAARVGDIDVNVEYDPSHELACEFVEALPRGRDYHAPFRKALRGSSRSVDVQFGFKDGLPDDAVLVYQRGDALEAARARVAGNGRRSGGGRGSAPVLVVTARPAGPCLSRPRCGGSVARATR
jgi:hypothetical protein